MQAAANAGDQQTSQAAATETPAQVPARVVERVDTGVLLKTEFELPVEKKNPDGSNQVDSDGKRQFELRVHSRAPGDFGAVVTNIQANSDYSQVSKNGDRWRDWMAMRQIILPIFS